LTCINAKVFNTEQMNQAVFAFRRYEDASLRYTGIESHEGLTHTDFTTRWWRGRDFPASDLRRLQAFSLPQVIPTPIDQNRCAQWRSPMDMMRQG
jgi:hypothetical protein